MSKKLTHADRRNKQRAHTPAAKRRAARTSKLRAIARALGLRRTKTHTHAEAKLPQHKARVPGTVRKSRLPGGSGFRNNWQAVLLLAIFLSSCLWAVPGIAKGVPTDGLRPSSTGVYADPCGDTSFAARFYGDSVRCLTAMGPLEFPLPAHSFKPQRPIPFLVDSDWYFSKAPVAKDPERFHHEYKIFVRKEDSLTSLWAIPIALVISAMLLTYVTLRDWEAPFDFDKYGTGTDNEDRV